MIKSRVMRCDRQVSYMGDGRGTCGVLMGKPEGKRQLGRARRRWKDNIKVYVNEKVGGGWSWNRSDQVTGAFERCGQFSGSVNCGEFLD
jgi:hypothetical protein